MSFTFLRIPSGGNADTEVVTETTLPRWGLSGAVGLRVRAHGTRWPVSMPQHHFFFCGGGEGERAWGSGTDADLRVYCQLCGLLLPTRHLASALHLLRIIKKPPKWPQVHFRPGRRPLGAFHSNLSLTLAILSPVTPGWGTRSRDLVQEESIS